MATLTLDRLEVTIGDHPILRAIDLSVGEAEMVAVVGHSGSGKSTLLRAVAGLDAVTAGRVLIGDTEVTRVPPHLRNVAMVFQADGLYPFMTARDNVSFPLQVRHHDRQDIDLRVTAEMRALGLGDLMQRRPSQLAAGEQQLVAVARAMVRAPDVFLMDEPLARLDTALRTRTRDQLRTVQQGYGVTTLYVTNDPVEAAAVADRLAVLVAGQIVQVGTPTEVYRRPVTLDAAEVTGDVSVIEVVVQEAGEGFWLVGDGVRVRAWTPLLGRHAGRGLLMMVRPEDLDLSAAGGVEAAVTGVSVYGSHVMIDAATGSGEVTSRTVTTVLRPGDRVRFDVVRWVLFDPVTRRIVA